MEPVAKFDVHHPQDPQIGQMEAHVFELPTGQARVEFYYPWGGSYIQDGSDRYYEPFLAHSVDSAINSLEIIYGEDNFRQFANRRRSMRKRGYTRNVTDLGFSKFEHYLLEQANGAETDARYADEGYEQGFYDGKRAAYSDALYRIDQYFDII